MTQLRMFQVDAFAGAVFRGNPAAVCPLESWLDDDQMQAIAAENNLAETAFFVPEGDGYRLRWFTPRYEVDLCGHATLASAFVVFTVLEAVDDSVRFETRSGLLEVSRDGNRFVMDFPARPGTVCPDPPADLLEALDIPPTQVLWAAGDYFGVYESEDEVRTVRPDLRRIERLESRGAVVTAPGRDTDFVSRYFAPRYGIPEDPVTGSTHCTLVPYWAERLGKTRLHARQVSSRQGELFCEMRGERVAIAGEAVLYLEGMIHL